MDVREGGTSLFCMRSPAFGDPYNTGTYQKIVEISRVGMAQVLDKMAASLSR
jgi:uncharacterized protein YndB with AHSA1/START domain